ncbi:carbohydrate ABC transporter permease [Enterococcus sp. LJL98]
MKKIMMYGFLGLFSIVFAFPFYFMLVSATNHSVDITKGALLPGSYLIQNFKNLMSQYNIGGAMWNSAKIAVLQTVFSLFIASLAGYGFEIHKSKGKEIIFNLLLLSMMIPFAAIMIPLFQMFGQISQVIPAIGIDTISAVILPYLTTAFLIFFFRQNTRMFPKSLLEAGRIDGLSEIGLFTRIYVPTMRTTYAAAGIITFMSSWNSYIWPLIILQTPEKQTLPLLISNLGSSYTPDFGLMMLAIVLATIPTAVVFFVLQKYFVAGMLGSVK